MPLKDPRKRKAYNRDYRKKNAARLKLLDAAYRKKNRKRIGGTSNIGNIQPLCQPCNSSKNAKTTDYRTGAACHRSYRKA